MAKREKSASEELRLDGFLLKSAVLSAYSQNDTNAKITSVQEKRTKSIFKAVLAYTYSKAFVSEKDF